MATWGSTVFNNAWITMNGSWGNKGNYNMNLYYYNASDYGTTSDFSKLRLEVRPDETENNVKTVGEVTVTTETLSKATFTFNLSNYITPASLQVVLFRIRFINSSGSIVRTINLVNDTVKSVTGIGSATMVYVKANEPPSTLTFTTSNSNYQDFTKPLTISWNAVSQTGSFAPHHYKIWIRFSYDDGATWVTDNNYIGIGWGIEGTSYTFTLANLPLDTKNLNRYGRFKVRIGISTLDNANGNETTRSTTKWFVMTPYVISTFTGNLIAHTENNGQISIGNNNTKKITSINNMKVKILDDGSEWARIFWHDVSSNTTYFANSSEAKNCNLANRFSRLSYINNYRHNDKYEFMLCYPKYSTTKYNRWIQTANPLTTTANATQTADTMGYRGVHIDFTTNWKYGMGLSSSSQAFMDCEAGHINWFGGIGLYSAYQGGFPAPTESGMSGTQKEVELWVRLYNSVDITPSTLSDTIYLRTSSDFYTFCNNVSNGETYKGKTVILLTDVTTSGASEHRDFNPAGDGSHPFEGTFDGNGHTLSIVYIDNNVEKDSIGFIGYNKGIIKNLCVNSMYMKTIKYGGLICGKNDGLIENCNTSGSVSYVSSSTYTIYNGGITGSNNGIIRKCLVNAQVSSPSSGGGISGGIAGENTGEIISCRVVGTISGYEAGGIVGYNTVAYSSITRCINCATINSTSSQTGGIVGVAYRGLLQSCLNMGSGASCGVIGNCTYATTNNCYYASDYNSSGVSFTDTGYTDVTIKKTLSFMKSQTMADLLGQNFFFYDNSWDSYISASSKQFIKFNWEKVSGWSNGESCGTGKFYYSEWTAPATKITVITYEDWNSIGEKPTKFEFYYKNNLYKTIINPPRNISIDVYGSFTESTSDKIAVKWYGKTGLKLSKESLISYGAACFLEGTKILTSNGLKPIETINKGDLILSKNEETGEIEEQIVYHTYNHNPRSCL